MRIVYVGTGEIGVPAYRRLLEAGWEVAAVVTQPDRPAGRRQELQPSPVKREALSRHQPVFQPEKINTAESLSQLRHLEPDLMVVCAYGQILKPEVLAVPRLGCLNIHASLLPRYRGAACIQAAIRNGDPETGVTIMWMDAGLDTGDILLRRSLPILPDDTARSLHDRLAEAAPGALLEALELIASGSAPREPQDNEQASYVGRLSREDGRIDWTLPAGEIGRHVRAMNPWPSAHTRLGGGAEGRQLKIHAATVVAGGGNTRPGEVVRAADGELLVATGSGWLSLVEVQLEGRQRLPVSQFLRGNPLEPGMVLGGGE